MLEQLKIYFIEECNTSTLDFKYKSYPDLSGMTNDQLWFHANEYGYKEQRQIFHDCYYNSLFYDYYLADYRKIVLYHNPYFDWKIYKPTSEYDALIHYINKCDLSYNDVLTDVSYTNPHYSIVAECPSYDYQKFTFAYGAGQWSSGFFGLIVPCKSILKRVYFMYLYDSVEEYQVSEISDKYVFNSSSVRIKLDLYINGSMSDYYVEETLDASKNMLGALFKKKNINGPTISVDYDEIILEENSVISWFCSDLLSQTTNHEFINNPYNPARNRFIMILEPYNTRYVSNPNIDLGTINSDIKMNQYNISLKQNKLNSGNNIQIVDNIISVVGLSGVESNFYYVNQLRNDVESSFVEINDLITNITIDTNMSNSVYDLSSSIEALYLDVSNLKMTKQPTINEGDLLISDTSGLELTLDGKQDTISFLSDICLNDLHVHGNIIIDGSRDAVQEIYSKNGISTLKLGDNDGTTTTFTNILKSENGNATFYGKDEMKYMEYNSVDDSINLSKDLSCNEINVNGAIIGERGFNSGDGAGLMIKSTINPSINLPDSGSIFEVRSKVESARLWVGHDLTSTGSNKFLWGFNKNYGQEGYESHYSGKLDTDGAVYCTEIRVNQIPLNAFYNFTYGYNYTPTNITGFGKGLHIMVNQLTFKESFSHHKTFNVYSESFTCDANYLGTYEINAHVTYRNLDNARHTPVISISINDDTLIGSVGRATPKWDVALTNDYCQHNIFSSQYARMSEGQVTTLSCSRIYHFTNTTDEVNINTFIQRGGGTTFANIIPTAYSIINAGISFKYIGNFQDIQS